jgi:hypothetical protein
LFSGFLSLFLSLSLYSTLLYSTLLLLLLSFTPIDRSISETRLYFEAGFSDLDRSVGVILFFQQSLFEGSSRSDLSSLSLSLFFFFRQVRIDFGFFREEKKFFFLLSPN